MLNRFNHNEQILARSRFFSQILEVNSPAQLSRIYSNLRNTLDKSFENNITERGKIIDGWTSVKLAFTIGSTVSEMMGLAFFGEELASNTEFASVSKHAQDMIKSIRAFQITPNFLAPYVHNWITNNGKAMHTLLQYITPFFTRARNTSLPDQPYIAYSMAKLNPDSEYWTPSMLAQAILGIWFVASHQPWMNLDFILLELSIRPGSVEILRAEIGDPDILDYAMVEELPYLDSFIKETVRLNPLDTMAIRRKALRHFTFSSGGPHVLEGHMACISLCDAMRNEADYPNANVFDGSRFTDVSEKYSTWGFGSLACQGRFHASLIMKLVLIHVIARWEFRLEDEKASRQWKWETFKMPWQSTRVQFRKLKA